MQLISSHNTNTNIIPIKAAFPALFALSGKVGFQTSHNIKPRTGKIKLKIAIPVLGASSGISFLF